MARLRLGLWRLRAAVQDRLRGPEYRRQVFGRIYAANLWGDAESRSGAGSGLEGTAAVRRELPLLMQKLGVRTMLDAPCGDFFWMREIAGSLPRYVGVDIVPEMVARNRERFGSTQVTFQCADIAADPLPAADLVLCRDCFIHLPTRLIVAAIRNFQATGARYLLLTNDRSAPPYHDIPLGSFRSIDFTRPPFAFPEPLCRILEDTTGVRELCAWELQALRV